MTVFAGFKIISDFEFAVAVEILVSLDGCF